MATKPSVERHTHPGEQHLSRRSLNTNTMHWNRPYLVGEKHAVHYRYTLGTPNGGCQRHGAVITIQRLGSTAPLISDESYSPDTETLPLAMPRQSRKNISFPANAAGGKQSFPTHNLAGSQPHDATHCACAHDCTWTVPA